MQPNQAPFDIMTTNIFSYFILLVGTHFWWSYLMCFLYLPASVNVLTHQGQIISFLLDLKALAGASWLWLSMWLTIAFSPTYSSAESSSQIVALAFFVLQSNSTLVKFGNWRAKSFIDSLVSFLSLFTSMASLSLTVKPFLFVISKWNTSFRNNF